MRVKSEKREKKRQKARYAPKGGTLAAAFLKRRASRDFLRRPGVFKKKKR